MRTYMKRYKNISLEDLSAVEIYNMVRNGTIRTFPRHFFNCEETDALCQSIVRYLVEDILQWKTREEVPLKIRKNTFRENKLYGMISIVYNNSPSKAIMDAYPERDYKEWEFHETPNSFWRGDEGRENAIRATKWLFEEKMQLELQDIKKNMTWNIFQSNGLLGMLKISFNNSLWECVQTVYPGEFKRWELGEHVPNEYWDKDKGVGALKWLIEEKLQWSKEEVGEYLSRNIFVENDLYGMIQRCFSSNIYLALETAYPGEYKPWELKKVTNHYWSIDNAVKATKWLIEEKLKWNDDDIRLKLSGRTFKDNGLTVISENYTPYEVISKAYPERNYKPWELRATTPFNYWNQKNTYDATKWLVEEKLRIPVSEAKSISKRVFAEYGISGAIKWYKGSVNDLISEIYEK